LVLTEDKVTQYLLVTELTDAVSFQQLM